MRYALFPYALALRYHVPDNKQRDTKSEMDPGFTPDTNHIGYFNLHYRGKYSKTAWLGLILFFSAI